MAASSHRDLRARRQASRLLGMVTGSVLTLGLLAAWAPSSWWPALAFLGLIAVGAIATWRGNSLAEEYEIDLRSASEDPPGLPGRTRAELARRRRLENGRASPLSRSPHARFAGPLPDF